MSDPEFSVHSPRVTHLKLLHQGTLSTQEDAEQVAEYFVSLVPRQIIIDGAREYAEERRKSNRTDWDVVAAFPGAGGAAGSYIRDSLRGITSPDHNEMLDYRWTNVRDHHTGRVGYEQLLSTTTRLCLDKYKITHDYIPPEELVMVGINLSYKLKMLTRMLCESTGNSGCKPSHVLSLLDHETLHLIAQGKPATDAYSLPDETVASILKVLSNLS